MALPARHFDTLQEVQRTMIPILCPLCKRAMIPDPEISGVWRCPKISLHEFHTDEEAVNLPPHTYVATEFGLPCPVCKHEMHPVPGTAGSWRCVANEDHEFLTGGGGGGPRLVCVKPSPMPQDNGLLMRASPLTLRHWLSHIGIISYLPSVPQCNPGDGTYCQPLGPIAPGGGGGGGRRRKKGDKGGKKFSDEPWCK